MRQRGNGEIIIFADKSFFGNGQLVKQFFIHIIQPFLCIGEKK